MPASSRRYPWVCFTPDREAGKDILKVENINYTQDGVQLLKDVSFIFNKGDKIALVGYQRTGADGAVQDSERRSFRRTAVPSSGV